MDLRAYYRKIREIEAAITERFVVIVSLATADGGKADVRTEVPKHVAARTIVEGYARLATGGETLAFAQENLEAQRISEQLTAANRVQVMVIPSNELRAARQQGKKEQS